MLVQNRYVRLRVHPFLRYIGYKDSLFFRRRQIRRRFFQEFVVSPPGGSRRCPAARGSGPDAGSPQACCPGRTIPRRDRGSSSGSNRMQKQRSRSIIVLNSLRGHFGQTGLPPLRWGEAAMKGMLLRQQPAGKEAFLPSEVLDGADLVGFQLAECLRLFRSGRAEIEPIGVLRAHLG